MYWKTYFFLVVWLLASCVPDTTNSRVPPVSKVARQDAALEGLQPVVWAMLSGDTNSRLKLVQFLTAEKVFPRATRILNVLLLM